ncbi:putative ribonuclease H-like domain-containing protein [Tanacetum coccineum]|uniref:Ribonuclease H-like domain-containing protein n=1 Tax=Tanacetum coccineum TaxID=301880 RepID=A0ABQ5G2I3_9ASTR
MIDCLSIVETDKVNHSVETDIVKLVVEIKSFGKGSDEFDKDIESSDGLQPKQADLSCVHALNKLHLHETRIENLIDLRVKVIRCDNGTEFKNRVMNQFCEMKGIKREFSVARTLQQNGVAERKNRTLIEAARTMLADLKLPTTFWAEAVNTACYV